jgi:hypothetical protein
MGDLLELLNPAVLIVAVPVLIVLGWVLTEFLKHRERMAMIERGMDPDARKKAGASRQEVPRSERR